MTSGKELSDTEVYSIQRFASYKDTDGHWQFTVAEIAAKMHCDERTVSTYIREGNRSWHQVSRWRDDSTD